MMSKTRALRLASQAHSLPYWHGGWVFTSPWNTKDLNGPVTESRQADYWVCRQARACAVATVALELMGWDWYAAQSRAHSLAPGSARDIVNAALTTAAAK